MTALFLCGFRNYIDIPSNLPLAKGGYKLGQVTILPSFVFLLFWANASTSSAVEVRFDKFLLTFIKIINPKDFAFGIHLIVFLY